MILPTPPEVEIDVRPGRSAGRSLGGPSREGRADGIGAGSAGGADGTIVTGGPSQDEGPFERTEQRYRELPSLRLGQARLDEVLVEGDEPTLEDVGGGDDGDTLLALDCPDEVATHIAAFVARLADGGRDGR